MIKKSVFMVIMLSLSLNSFALIGFNEKSALLENEKNTMSIFEKNVNSVVHISNLRRVRRGGGGFFFFNHPPRTETIEGEGTGFVWDTKGHIVTNYHVIRGGSKFFIKFPKDSKKYEAKLIGSEPSKDIALLKLVELPSKLTPVSVGRSRGLKVGQKALAIGNPFGLNSTITQGIISAIGRKIKGVSGIEIYGMIQTDSSINPGNSGGPLINSSGDVIGVNTMIFSHSGSSAGVGFAVPIDTVQKIIPELIKHGEVKRAGFGIRPIERDELEYYYGINVPKGLPIGYAFEDGPADRAGLRGMTESGDEIFLGDIILSIDGKDINSFDDIFNILFEYSIGDTVILKYLRGKEEKTTKIKLEELKPTKRKRRR